jgi:hypothetical protein
MSWPLQPDTNPPLISFLSLCAPSPATPGQRSGVNKSWGGIFYSTGILPDMTAQRAGFTNRFLFLALCMVTGYRNQFEKNQSVEGISSESLSVSAIILYPVTASATSTGPTMKPAIPINGTPAKIPIIIKTGGIATRFPNITGR